MRWVLSIIIGLVVWLILIVLIVGTMNLAAGRPGSFENSFMTRIKYWRVGDKGVSNPTPDNSDTVKQGADHFQHHCQICHGLDGQNTGVPVATRTQPPVADLSSARVQRYSDGQLKWIIDNGIRFSGMPGWKGILSDEEAWNIVRYIRHLPPKGSLGTPTVFQEAEEEHEHGRDIDEEHRPQNQQHPHTH